MSREAIQKIEDGLAEALVYAGSQRALLDQVTIAINALQAIALDDSDAKAVAKAALLRIIELVPSSPHTEKGE